MGHLTRAPRSCGGQEMAQSAEIAARDYSESAPEAGSAMIPHRMDEDG
jgi:hypothetical protein